MSSAKKRLIMSLPSLSVIMAAYNSEDYLEAAIESVLAQSFSNFEFIIVDDGSTDSTPDILQHYAAQDDRIVVIPQTNQGRPAAANAGLAVSRADVIARIDADDRMLPQRLEKQLAFLEQHPEVTVVSCLAHYINTRGEVIGKNYTDLLTVADCQRYVAEDRIIFCLHPGATFRKQPVLEIGGYRREMIYAQDIDLWNRLADHQYYTVVMPEILMQYRIHPEASMTKVKERSDFSGWVIANTRRRRRGEAELSLVAFREQLAAAPWRKRLKRRWIIYRDAYYRSAGLMFGSRRYGWFVAYMLAASVMGPRYVFFKLSRQIFSKGSLTAAEEVTA